nr:retrovirus-related Pol polyprotein from transposon TNT 1-94 [Tanacetum cinerariifolium]
MENTNLKGQIQEKVFVTTALQKELRILKGIIVLDNDTTITNAITIAPGMFKLYLDPLAPRLLKNRDAHIDYLKYTQEQADILQGIVEQAKAKQPLDNALDFSYFRFSKHMTWNRSQLKNFVSKFLGTVRFGNNQIAKSMGYGDYQLGNATISKNLEGVDLLSGSRDTNLYTISLDDMLKTSPICLLSKALKTKSWLWNHWLSHLNSGKIKKSSHQPKAEDTNQKKLYLLHMDLCGPMRVGSINEKRYILVIVDDHSQFTWVKFLRSKDEAPDAIIKCIKIAIVLKAVEIAASPSSTTIDQDAPSSNKVMLIKLKWIFKVKKDKFGRVLKNKERLFARGFRQEEGIDFEESFASVTRIEDIYTHMIEKNKLDADIQGTPVDDIHYHGMIGSLVYLMSSRPDLIYAVCLCARFQAKPVKKHLNAVKRVFRYLKGTIKMGLWYSKDT